MLLQVHSTQTPRKSYARTSRDVCQKGVDLSAKGRCVLWSNDVFQDVLQMLQLNTNREQGKKYHINACGRTSPPRTSPPT